MSGGVVLSVFKRKSCDKCRVVRFVTGDVACGIGNVLRNKGAVAAFVELQLLGGGSGGGAAAAAVPKKASSKGKRRAETHSPPAPPASSSSSSSSSSFTLALDTRASRFCVR